VNAASERDLSHLARAYEGEPSSLRSARADISAWLRARGGDDDTVERAVLIASELATNAVHATPGMPYSVVLRSIGSDHVELTISNSRIEAVLPPRTSWAPQDVLAPQGRGLSIVAALSEDVSVQVGDDRVLVTARIRTTPLR
jgi:anti-sigma regulatory factor (Ser/Thr protein kinase)